VKFASRDFLSTRSSVDSTRRVRWVSLSRENKTAAITVANNNYVSEFLACTK
jgi:hypothetical protein